MPQDIFGDAGTDYELPERRAGEAAAAVAAAKRNTYFDRKDEMQDLPALPPGETHSMAVLRIPAQPHPAQPLLNCRHTRIH